MSEILPNTNNYYSMPSLRHRKVFGPEDKRLRGREWSWSRGAGDGGAASEWIQGVLRTTTSAARKISQNLLENVIAAQAGGEDALYILHDEGRGSELPKDPEILAIESVAFVAEEAAPLHPTHPCSTY
jgi:hypothetical protein